MFRALRVDEPSGDDGNVDLIDDLEIDALMPGDVDIDVAYSSINYKDGMALAGKPGVIKSYPLSGSPLNRSSAGGIVAMDGRVVGVRGWAGVPSRRAGSAALGVAGAA